MKNEDTNNEWKDKVKNPIVLSTIIVSAVLLIVGLSFASKFYQVRNGPNTVQVLGTSEKIITSDIAQWSGDFEREVALDGVKAGTNVIASDKAKVLAYLQSNGFADNEITFSSLRISKNTKYSTDSKGREETVDVGYILTQGFTVKTNDVDKVSKALQDSGSLIANGILFNSGSPEYFYSKIGDVKIDLINAATQDALNRATKIVSNSGSHLAGLREAHMGLVQITPEVSTGGSDDYSNYDTNSISKRVTVTLHASFLVK